MTPQTDVLLVTVTAPESKAVFAAIRDVNGDTPPKTFDIGARVYRDLGIVNGARICHTQCEMGASGLGSSLQAIEHSIRDLSPHSVVMVGIAFGMNEEKQKIGDVLVSKQLWLYDLQKVDKTGRVIPRGSKPDCSDKLLGRFRALETEADFEIPLRFGLVLSGEKLVDNLDYRESLKELEPEAIGGEMEGAGLYVACQSAKIDWILVKAICDWADGNKSEDKAARQALAARNAAHTVAKALILFSFQRPEVARRPFESNLPQGRGRFFGREELKREISDWATAGETGVLCLHGPGGVGKTRLSEEAGRALAEPFDLVWKVSFESLNPETATGMQVAGQIALSLKADNVDEAAKQLPAFVKAKGERALLILDNFESADNAETQRWLAEFATSGIRCLVTSRKRLTLRNLGKNVAVELLKLPESASEDFDSFPSVQLFRDRLDEEVKLAPWTELSEEDRAGLVLVLNVTGGFPLAIEIVAANRIHAKGSLKRIAETIGVKALAYRKDLDESWGGPQRHESMGACFQWSLDLLPTEEAARFATLGVFPYDFSPSAAEAVCGVSETDLDRWWQRSLVQRELETPGDRRFLLSLLKEYAWDTCPPEVRRETESKAVSFFVEIIQSSMRDGRLDISNDAIRATLDAEWKTVLALRMTAVASDNLDGYFSLNDINAFLRLRGLWSEQEVIWIHQRDMMCTLNLASEANGVLLGSPFKHYEGIALANLGNVYRLQSRWTDAISCFQDSLEINRVFNDQLSQGLTLGNLGVVYSHQGRWADAVSCYKDSLRLCIDFGDRQGEKNALINLGWVSFQQGRWDDAITCYENGLKIERAFGDRYGEAVTLGNLGSVYLLQDRWGDAITCYEDSLKIKRAFGDRHGEAGTLTNLGTLYRQQGRWTDAITCYEDSLKICRALGDRHGICLTIGNLGDVHLQKGELQKAWECHQEQARLAAELGDAIQLGKALTKVGIDLAMGCVLDKAVETIQQGIEILSKTQDSQSLEQSRAVLSQVQGMLKPSDAT